MRKDMKVNVEYWDNESKTVTTESGFCYLGTKSVVKRVEQWKGSIEEIFNRYDKQNNSLRYCNGSHYKFEDKTLVNEYLVWYKNLPENVKFNMYYGGGIVD